MQDIHRAKTALSATTDIQSGIRATYLPNILTRRWMGSRRRFVVVLVMISWDASLALAMWQAAFVLQAVLGHGQLSAIAIASIVPNIVAWIGLRAALGLYPGYGMDQVEELRRQTFALLATLTIIVVFAFVSELDDSLSRLFLFAWALGLLLVAPLARYLVKTLMMRYGLWGKPVVVLGGHEAGAQIVDVLQKEWQLGFRPVGFFDNRTGPTESEPYRGTLDAAEAMADEYGVDTAIFTMQDTEPAHLVKLLDQASTSFRYVMVMPNLGGITNSAVIARDFAGHFGVEIKHNLLFPWYRVAKRLLDLFGVVVGALLIGPLLSVIAVVIKLDSPGPAFFVQERPGLNGKMFKIFKFRTMYTDAEQRLEELWLQDPASSEEFKKHGKMKNDPRVTRVGRFLRKTSLDELPQLWNVFKGEMSLVGPRPYLTSQASQISGAETLISRVPPGITGLWQVSGRSDVTIEQRVDFDLYYVHNWSVWLDLVILARTVQIVLLNRGAY